jgi:penicillin-binding protein 1C
VSFIIFDILSDPDARRPMFGDLSPVFPFAVALKTGTTRAYTDNLAFGVTREYTVGAWAGNFDGKPTEGVMAMQGAAPLVRAAFVAIANRFGEPTAPPRPDGIVEADVCAVSGMRPSSDCHTTKHEKFIAGTVPAEPCTWHRLGCDEYPREVRSWARAQGMLSSRRCDPGTDVLRISFPAPDSHFLIDPGRPLSHQVPPLRASPAEKQGEILWTIDGRPPQDFRPTVGEHRVRAEHGGVQDEVRIYFD